MRLKEIKPGMVIHCKTQEEANILCGHTGIPDFWGNFWKRYGNATCYRIEGDGDCIYSYGNIDSYVKSNYKITEFSDLIIPELTAEEVLNILNEIRHCVGRKCNACPFLENNNGERKYLCTPNYGVILSNPEKLISICQQWKADHEKKEPEIETVDICRIIEVLPDRRKRCVHEEDLASGSTDEEIKILVEAELKRYCMEHDGKFIAVHDVVSRVKEAK